MKKFDVSMLAESMGFGGRTAQDASEWEQRSARSIVEARIPSMFLSQYLAPLSYRDTVRQRGEDFSFTDEADFWRASANLILSTVGLSRFRISDWFPRAPGVYWSRNGQRSRDMVFGVGAQHDDKLGAYYSPMSKLELIERGGIGTVRLMPKRIDGVNCRFGLATTGSQCAGGVPLAIPNDLLRSTDITWGDTVYLKGEVRYLRDVGLDDVAASVHHAAPIIVFVQEIKGVAASDRRDEPLILTPVVLFSVDGEYDRRRVRGREAFAYSFVQCSSSSPTELDDAAEWMSLYAAKHHGIVITNFDETYPTLADAPLSYQRLIAGSYDRAYVETMNLYGTTVEAIFEKVEQVNNINNVTLGDGTVVHGNLTVANSIKDSFNRGEAIANPDLRELMTKLSSQVGEMLRGMPAEAAERVADDLAALTKEATRPKPRQQWWQLSVDGIKEAATAVGDIGAPIVKTVKELLPLLAGM